MTRYLIAVGKQPERIRWRLNDPSEESQPRWTRAHIISVHADDLTACHAIIPSHPYMADFDGDIPADWPICKRCQRSNE